MYSKDVPTLLLSPRAWPARSLGARSLARRLALCGFALGLFALPARHAMALAPAASPAPKVDKQAIGQTALTSFQTRHRKVEDLVAAKASASKLKAQVDTLINYKALAQSALGGKSVYAGVCKQKCASFEAALTSLIQRNYLRFLRQSKGGQVKYLGTQVGRKGNAVKIKTQVQRSGKAKSGRSSTVMVSYVLQQAGQGDWTVVDIITEGVSLRKTYRYEFQKILETKGSKGGINGVIAKIQDKLTQLDAGDSAPPKKPATKGK